MRFISNANPGSAFLIRDPGSVKNQDPDRRNNFLGLKYFNCLIRIRNPGWKNSDPAQTSRIRNTAFYLVHADLSNERRK
jgi:hypothetical protein